MSRIEVIFDYICLAAERTTGLTDAEKRELKANLTDELASSIEDGQIDKESLTIVRRVR